MGPAQIKDRVLRPSCGGTHVRVYGCGRCSLHAPCSGLRRAVGNSCRMIWRVGRTEGKTDLSRRGGLEVGRIVRQKRQSFQVNCIADFGVQATEDVVESI